MCHSLCANVTIPVRQRVIHYVPVSLYLCANVTISMRQRYYIYAPMSLAISTRQCHYTNIYVNQLTVVPQCASNYVYVYMPLCANVIALSTCTPGANQLSVVRQRASHCVPMCTVFFLLFCFVLPMCTVHLCANVQARFYGRVCHNRLS